MPLPCINPADYAAQLASKLAQFKSDFAPNALPEPVVHASQPEHYRMRAEFRMWHQNDQVFYAMFDTDEPKRPVVIERFAAVSRTIDTAMPRLRKALEASKALKDNLFQTNFQATLSGELMITLIYHRLLDTEWEAAARELAAAMNIQLIGRSRNQAIVIGRDWVLEEFELNGRRLRYQQVEGAFSQPNGEVNRQMLGWACQQASGLGGDLLELYCGNGNFTIALAPLFGRVLATEVSKSSVKAAQYNLEANGVDNVALARLSSNEISEAIAGTREFVRLQDIPLQDHRFTTLFVDPPRSGLDDGTLELARGFEHVLYISCNPQTLRDNVAALHATHAIAASAVFDQFPYTPHLESGLLLTRRTQEAL